jgi:tetratricopeptide (TPR) repeat protein
MRTGKKDEGRKAFESAVKNDDHLALAFVNLARLDISDGNYKRADQNLDRALSADPENLDALALATLAEFMVGRMESVVDNARRVHAQIHPQYAIVHLLAARALHKQNLDKESAAEYKLFLEESPTSPNAPRARTELEALQKKTP